MCTHTCSVRYTARMSYKQFTRSEFAYQSPTPGKPGLRETSEGWSGIDTSRW